MVASRPGAMSIAPFCESLSPAEGMAEASLLAEETCDETSSDKDEVD